METYEQINFEGHPRLDRDKGVIYHTHVLGCVSANGYEYSIPSMRECYTKYEGMPVGIDHNYQSSPIKVSDVWGELSNPTCDNEGIWADLSYLRSHPLTEQIIEDLSREDTALFSLSSVNGGVIQKGRVIEKFSPIRCDLVVRGATTKTLLEQDNKMEVKEIKIEEPVVVEQVVEEVKVVTFEQYQSLESKYTDLLNKVVELEKRLELHNEYLSPKTTLEQTILSTVAGIDLKEFWKD